MGESLKVGRARIESIRRGRGAERRVSRQYLGRVEDHQAQQDQLVARLQGSRLAVDRVQVHLVAALDSIRRYDCFPSRCRAKRPFSSTKSRPIGASGAGIRYISLASRPTVSNS
jgi:hypothetical protein